MPVPAFPHRPSGPSWQRGLQVDTANIDYGDSRTIDIALLMESM